MARMQTALDGPVFQARFTQRPGKARTTPENGARDVEAVQGLFASPAVLAIMDTPFTPLFIFAIFLFHPWLGWLAVTGGGVLVGLTLFNQWLTGHPDALSRTASQAAHRLSEDARHASDIIRAQGMLAAMTEHWISVRAGALEQSMTAIDRNGGISSFTKAFRLALQSLMLALGAACSARAIDGGRNDCGVDPAGSRAVADRKRFGALAADRPRSRRMAGACTRPGQLAIRVCRYPSSQTRCAASGNQADGACGYRATTSSGQSFSHRRAGRGFGRDRAQWIGKDHTCARFSVTRYFWCWTSQIRHSTWRAPMR
jgi:hypothetical protein